MLTDNDFLSNGGEVTDDKIEGNSGGEAITVTSQVALLFFTSRNHYHI